MIDLDLTGRTALVFGASQGIGRACAIQLAEQGAQVIVCARREEVLQDLVNLLPKKSGVAHTYSVIDLGKNNELEAKLDTILKQHKRIDIILNNAGGPKPGPISKASHEDFENAFNMHVQASSLIVKKCLPGMKENKFGRIINIISSSVKSPIDNLGISNTTRWAVAAWAKTLSYEVAEFGVTVNCVLPGFIMTPRLQQLISSRAKEEGVSEADIEVQMSKTVPAARFGRPEEMANAVGFLASAAAAYINGVALLVDGGKTRCF